MVEYCIAIPGTESRQDLKICAKIAPRIAQRSSKSGYLNPPRISSFGRTVLKREIACAGISLLAIAGVLTVSPLKGADQTFHDAPASAKSEKNPYAGKNAAVAAGAKLYGANCSSCHGPSGRGTGNIPPLAHGAAQSASDGEIFWFITKGDVNNGMPSWQQLPDAEPLGTGELRQIAAECGKRWRKLQPPKSPRSPTPAPVRLRQRRSPISAMKSRGSSATLRCRTCRRRLPPSRRAMAHNWRPSGKRLAASAGWIQSGALCQRPRWAAPDSHRAQWRSFCGGERSWGHQGVSRNYRAPAHRSRSQVFASGLKMPYGIAFYPPGPTRSGCMWAIPMRSCASLIKMAI